MEKYELTKEQMEKLIDLIDKEIRENNKKFSTHKLSVYNAVELSLRSKKLHELKNKFLIKKVVNEVFRESELIDDISSSTNPTIDDQID